MHAPAWSVPRDVAGPFRFGTWREPEGWYASLYRHSVRAGPFFAAWLAQWGNGSTAWPAVLHGWTHPATVNQLPEAHVLGVIWGVQRGLPAPPTEVHRSVREGGVGFATWAHVYTYGVVGAWRTPADPVWGMDAFVCCDTLAQDLPELLPSVRVVERLNAASEPSVSWTPEQRAWVRASDGALVSHLR